MNNNNSTWNVNIKNSGGYLILVAILVFLLSISFVASAPSAPIINYVTNTTYTSGIINRSIDAKGTITTVTLSSTQQDYKWKAYVGNVSGTLALADAGGKAIYDWSSGTVTGEVYISRYSNINWNNITCAVQSTIDAEQSNLSMASTIRDNINSTFNSSTHASFLVGTTNITSSSCRSIATYLNGVPQALGPTANFQEILLRDSGTGNLVYAGLINAGVTGYNNANKYDFQIIVGENESATIPTNYYFWVELG